MSGARSARRLFAARARRLPDPVPLGAVVAQAEGLEVRLAGRTVLAEAELTVRAGEVLALVGPNGAGKSTLLAALAADLPAESGTVRLDGRPVAAWTPGELALRRAVLPQTATLSFPFTVEEVVRMGRAPWAGTPAEDEDEAAVAAAMDRTEVAEFAARPFSALSGGERARVALARVLAQRTALLLLDEPTAALDLRHQELVLRVCRERPRRGTRWWWSCTICRWPPRTRTGRRCCTGAGSRRRARPRRSSTPRRCPGSTGSRWR
ncbi:hypothetical protein GCM10009548_07000 [Streptomyces malaysiensis subsp. malaysiensis]